MTTTMIMIMTMMIPRWRQHRWRLDNVDVAPVPHCFANPLMAQLLGFHSPCPMLHATFAIPHLRSLSTLLMRCDKLCHWTALALVFSWFSRVKLEMKNYTAKCRNSQRWWCTGHAFE